MTVPPLAGSAGYTIWHAEFTGSEEVFGFDDGAAGHGYVFEGGECEVGCLLKSGGVSD